MSDAILKLFGHGGIDQKHIPFKSTFTTIFYERISDFPHHSHLKSAVFGEPDYKGRQWGKGNELLFLTLSRFSIQRN